MVVRHELSCPEWSSDVQSVDGPLELNATQVDEHMNRPSKGKVEGFGFPEDLIPACTQVDLSVPLMTLLNCLLELLRSGGSYTLLRMLWGCCRVTLGPENPLFSLRETLVTIYSFRILILSSCRCRVLSGYCLGWVIGSWVDIMIFVLVFSLSGVVPRLLGSLVAKIAAFREYSVFFVDDNVTPNCVVQTWDDHELFCVSIHVEACGQRIPIAELAGLLRIVDSVASCQLPLSCQGGSPTLLRVVSENRVNGRQFMFCQTFSEEIFQRCYRDACQEVFGMLDVTVMVDFIMLRLRGALQESCMADVPTLRRCVIAGQVLFPDPG